MKYGWLISRLILELNVEYLRMTIEEMNACLLEHQVANPRRIRKLFILEILLPAHVNIKRIQGNFLNVIKRLSKHIQL
jgi:hypothetical protein